MYSNIENQLCIRHNYAADKLNLNSVYIIIIIYSLTNLILAMIVSMTGFL